MTDAKTRAKPSDRGRPCPVCRKPSVTAFRPFCSKRCADIDLGRWLGEQYRIPVEDEPGDDAFADEDPADRAPAGPGPTRH